MHLFTPLYSHNRLHSSHHRLIVSYTVSSPTCSCTLSLHDALPISSAVVADGAPQIPADLDLLCELVLNETSEEIPETTRGLIAALEPWQSIPVTLEAYRSHGEQASRTESAKIGRAHV